MIADAITGKDFAIVRVKAKRYAVFPPTINKLALAIGSLSELPDCDNLREILTAMGQCDKIAEALSYLIEGDDSIKGEFCECTIAELVPALETALTMVDVTPFSKAVNLAKSVVKMAVNPK